MSKLAVRQALERLTEHLQRKGAHVLAVYLPHENGKKCGVDDYLTNGHTLQDLETLVEGPRPQPQPARPLVELLDTAPTTMHRPLALIDGHAYAAIWPHVRVTITETTDKAGNIVKLNLPQVTTERRLLIVRDDGHVFGDGGDEPLEKLGIEVHLPEIPPAEKLWSAPGVKAYKADYRPDPADVFTRIVEVVDRFIDFDRSLADQRTMCEIVACYIVATWFLDAFTVIGFLWPNGDRGSGKTQFLHVVTEIASLGQTILAGGSYASLRDMADYGATLAFDDAENLSDPKRSDPDKRTLLLAGNRKGNTVPVKEQKQAGVWQTRYVHTYCPRLFSAIRLLDDVLSSRSIVVPLIRTPDRHRANADPLDRKLWPHDRRKLVDDLWSLAVAHLAELPSYETSVNNQAVLTGRNLEPWRASLAVAMWLADKGVKGLWNRMEKLSNMYQKERPELESSDLTALVIRALCQCAISAVSAVSAIEKETPLKAWTFTTKDVTDAAKAVATESELDIDPERVTGRRVGRTLGRMRLKKEPRPGGRGSHLWQVTVGDLRRWATLYSVQLPDFLKPPPPDANGTNGFDGTNGTADSYDPEADPMAAEERRAIQEEANLWSPAA